MRDAPQDFFGAIAGFAAAGKGAGFFSRSINGFK